MRLEYYAEESYNDEFYLDGPRMQSGQEQHRRLQYYAEGSYDNNFL